MKRIIDLNVKLNTIKLLEKKRKMSGSRMRENILRFDTKSTIRLKTNKGDFIKNEEV